MFGNPTPMAWLAVQRQTVQDRQGLAETLILAMFAAGHPSWRAELPLCTLTSGRGPRLGAVQNGGSACVLLGLRITESNGADDMARFELPTRCGLTTPVVAERQISQRVAQSWAPDSGGAAGEVSGI